MTEIIPFQPGPPPFGYKQAGLNGWAEEPKEQMAIGYIAQAHKDGVSLRKIAAAVESTYGFKMTHAGVDKILKRCQANDVNPIMRSRPALPMPQFKKGIVREETLADSSEAYANVESLIKSLALELGNVQVGTLMLRIRHRCERLTDNIDHWDESVLKTIESSYQNAKAREAYLREKEQPAPQAAPAQFKPGDVVEFDRSKWAKCGGYNRGDCCDRYTMDPKAAGWHQGHFDDEYECEECWQKGYKRGAHVSYRTKYVELELEDLERKFMKKEIDQQVKELKAQKKLERLDKIRLSVFEQWQKAIEQRKGTSYSAGGSFYVQDHKLKVKDEELMEIVYAWLNFDPATLPPIPPTISL